MAQGQRVEHLLLVDPPRGKAPSLHGLWSVFDIFGRITGSDLVTRINNFDHHGVSILRWYRFSLRGKLQGIGRRLGLTTAGSNVPVTAGDRHELGEPEILGSLDYALYFLSSCLFSLEPIKLPATVYFPAETSLRLIAGSAREWAIHAHDHRADPGHAPHVHQPECTYLGS